ncbi:hypothetical protein RJT34_07518 [Clitoria ternatea]|uniref:Uncharacterized protein n=1 Tax=Clitoria ternatea TaxID=43366 RepID=A0AAN9K580_CLITE
MEDYTPLQLYSRPPIDRPGPTMLVVVEEDPDDVTIGQRLEVEHPFEKDVEVIESSVRGYRDPSLPLGVKELEEIIGWEAALAVDPVGPYPLLEPYVFLGHSLLGISHFL